MKVSVAHVVNGQVAGAGDLTSLIGDAQNGSFASLLTSGGSEAETVHRTDGNRARRDTRSKEKESKGQSQSPVDSQPSTVSNPAKPQRIPSLSVTPWQFELDNSGANRDAEDASISPALGEPEQDAIAISGRRPAAMARAGHVATSNSQSVLDENGAEIVPFHPMNDPQLLEPTKVAIADDHDATATKVNVPLNNGDAPLIVEQSSSVTSGNVPLSPLINGKGVADLVANGETDPHFVETFLTQRYAVPKHEVKSNQKSQSATIDGGVPSSGVLHEDEGASGKSSTHAQGVGVTDGDSSSMAGGRNQGNPGDLHRGSSEAKAHIAADLVPTLRTEQSSTAGPLDTSLAHGHTALMNSSHLPSARESTSDTLPKESALQRASEVNAARLLGSSMRGDLRVGVQTESFGRVTIQTNAQPGQLSAQVSLENARDGPTLAAHLPGVEQKIGQEHGLNASVRLVDGFDGRSGAGSMGRDQSGSDKREPERYRSDSAIRIGRTEHDSSNESRGAEAPSLRSRYVASSRLDVTV